MKHTKGPWIIGPYYKETVTESDTDDVIAQPGRNFSTINPSQTLEANAHLIAAAPDMLEALDRLIRAVNVPIPDPLIVMATLEQAKEAISKAKGD